MTPKMILSKMRELILIAQNEPPRKEIYSKPASPLSELAI
jgi:hypothetical protein